ncbi:malto-oligosyltrehalose trehalohydrolase [Pseudonocardiaceae bacterium YIM PH 21723]|nr:malto-oligosyltrehalose trehalohydrolase [Pseudonocardiaceae bacterium YIM PH 21723]
MEFSVWAPKPERVRLWVDGTAHPMRQAGGGWWRAEVDARPEADYGYLLDDDYTVLPDPRSLRQPAGVHAAGRRYSHDDFAWTDHAWTGRALPGSVIYELHIGTFTEGGTFDAAIDRLDHLVDLGVDLVEVLPINGFDGTHNWGYDGVLWYTTHEPYGGPDGFKRFVDACHRRGLGVILDVVYNHLGPSGAYLDRFGPYFAGRNIWGPSLNLDGPESDEVRRYVIDNALGWLRDFHVDGLRLDAVHALVDRRATTILAELSAEVDALAAHARRPLTLIAESDLNDPKLITSREAGGYGLPAQWDDDVHHCLHSTLTGEGQGYYADFTSLSALATVLTDGFLHAGTWSSFRKRTHGAPIDRARIPGHRLVVCLQNHDQIGNRATGDRLTATLSTEQLLTGAALLLCSPFTPMLFMGEEWGARTPWQFFSSFADPDLAEAVRKGRFAEFAEHGWTGEVPDPMSPKTFVDSTLDWREPDKEPHGEILRTYRRLIALRRSVPELTDPRLDRVRVDYDEDARWLVLHRGNVRVATNFGPAVVELPIALDEVLLSGNDIVTSDNTISLPPHGFLIGRVRTERERSA